MKRLWILLLMVMLCAPAAFAEGETPASQPTETPAAQPMETPSPESAPTPAPAEPIEYGDKGEKVEKLQEKLSELGYYQGRITGNFLDGTKQGVMRFQKDYGLEETGILDAASAAALEKAKARGLKFGDEGDDVRRLQKRLKELKYMDVNATGRYGQKTEAAVQEYQVFNDLPMTGEADLDTQIHLYSDYALAKGARPTPTPLPGTDLGDINDVVMAGDGESTEDTLEGAEYSRRLTRGVKGEEVKMVQTRLKDLGFFNGPVSGNFMDQTIAATKAFQEHNGMRPDGIVGQETWDMLFNSDEVLDTSATPRPTPVPTPVPYAITVDVENQVTTVYGRDDKGEFTVPVRQMVCSTGFRSTPSDVGEWVLNGRRARWAYFSKWGSHAQYWTRINENIAFHSVIYRQVDYNSMSTKSYRKLGQRASHGCIRLLVEDARWIYENIGEGVVVTITEDLPSDEELRRAVKAPPLNKSKTGPITTPEPTLPPVYDPTGTPPPLERMQRENEGEDVYWLQCKLKDLGYYTGTVTGGYYGGTIKAVKAFQKDHDIYPSGKADIKTLEAIYADVLPTPTPEPELTPQP